MARLRFDNRFVLGELFSLVRVNAAMKSISFLLKHAFHLILSLFYAAFINSQPFFGFLCKKGWCIALIISVIHIGLLLTGVRMPVQENPHFRDFLL